MMDRTSRQDPAAFGIGHLFWLVSDAVIVAEVNSGQIVLWNPAAEAILGYSASEALALTVRDLAPERLRARHPLSLSDYAAMGLRHYPSSGKYLEVPARRKDGGEIVVELTLIPLANVELPGSYVAAFIRDGSARKRIEAERDRLLSQERANRAQLEALLGATTRMGSKTEPEEILRGLVEEVAVAMRSERAFYILEKEGRLLVPATWNEGAWQEANVAPPIDQSIPGLVWRTGHAYRTNNRAIDPNANQEIGEKYAVRSLLAAPLHDDDRMTIGVVGLINSRQAGGFSEADEALLVAFCECASASFYRAQTASSLRSVETEQARLEGVLLTARGLANRINQDVGVIVGRAEVLQQLVGAQSPEFASQLEAIRESAMGIAKVVALLQQASRVVINETSYVGPVLDIQRSSR